MIIDLPGHRSTSWNKYYGGRHWAQRREHVNLVRALVLEQLDPNVEMFDAPVDIIVTARFKSHPQDPDNVCAKVYIDALLGRVIEDDTMEYVASVTTKVVEAEENGVRIEVRQAV